MTSGSMARRTVFFACFFAVFGFTVDLPAQEKPSDKAAEKADKPVEKDKPAEKDKPKSDGLSITQHELTIGGEKFQFTATAGLLPMVADDGKTKAEMFFIAYTKDGVTDFSKRNITFCFNGGPGSSSVWLHMGMLGPKRVKLNDDATPSPPPFELVENGHSLLDVTDLVFIDPVSTGYSRPTAGEDKKQFHGYDEDIRSVGQFIHLYTTRYKRWPSPRFLMGESYGCLRAAGLSGYLQDRYNMELNGVVLISSVLDFQTLAFGETNDLPYILFLPSYTATAHYHKKLPEDLQKDMKKTLAEVEEFATGPYATALLKGAAIPKAERQAIVEKLARYTGLSPAFVDRSDLRIDMGRFAKELLHNERRTIGRFDSRYRGIDRDQAGDSAEYDPSGAALFGAYTATLYDFLRNDLKVEKDSPYEILTSKVHPWNYDRFENRYVTAAETLRRAMTKNPFLKVFVANGYYDLATPYLASIYSFNHLGLEESLRSNVSMGFYDGGHMMYVHEPSLAKLKADLVKFYKASVR